MHSDPRLVERVNAATRGWPGLAPKQMFGGMAWLLRGNMCVGIWHESLIVRCRPEKWASLLEKPHVREMDITGRSMKGWLIVDPPALRTSAALCAWLDRSRDFVATLPPKR